MRHREWFWFRHVCETGKTKPKPKKPNLFDAVTPQLVYSSQESILGGKRFELNGPAIIDQNYGSGRFRDRLMQISSEREKVSDPSHLPGL
jgi:hypothetical protein